MSGIFSRQPSPPGQITPSRTRMALELRHTSALLSCRFDPSGRYVFAGAQDNTIQRWELAAPNAKVAFAGHRSWVRGIAFHAASRKMLSTDYNGKLLVWNTDAATPQAEQIIDAHEGWVRAIAMSPDQRQFATCGNDNLVKLWNFADFSLVREFAGHASHVYNVPFHPTERAIVSGDLRGNIKQ